MEAFYWTMWSIGLVFWLVSFSYWLMNLVCRVRCTNDDDKEMYTIHLVFWCIPLVLSSLWMSIIALIRG